MGHITAKGASFNLCSVSYSYPTGRAALRDVSLRIKPGEFCVICGANGSGKSTLARHLNGLLIPSSGCVLVDDLDTRNAQHQTDIRARVGMMFQNPDNQIVASIVQDDVAFGPENLGLEPAVVQARVTEALEHAGISGLAQRDVSTLSGGQRQLVALAGVLAMEPGALVLDEPDAMLDVRGREEAQRVCHTAHAVGTTVVLITHRMEAALRADHVVVLSQGEVALDGTPQDVLAQPDALQALQLAAPFPLALAGALAQRGIFLEERFDLAGMAGELAALHTAAAQRGERS